MNPVYVPRSRRPLTRAKEGEKVTIREVDGGRMLNGRLAEMGLYTGEKVTVVHNAGGAVIVQHRDCRLALGKGVSQKIMVE